MNRWPTARRSCYIGPELRSDLYRVGIGELQKALGNRVDSETSGCSLKPTTESVRSPHRDIRHSSLRSEVRPSLNKLSLRQLLRIHSWTGGGDIAGSERTRAVFQSSLAECFVARFADHLFSDGVPRPNKTHMSELVNLVIVVYGVHRRMLDTRRPWDCTVQHESECDWWLLPGDRPFFLRISECCLHRVHPGGTVHCYEEDIGLAAAFEGPRSLLRWRVSLVSDAEQWLAEQSERPRGDPGIFVDAAPSSRSPATSSRCARPHEQRCLSDTTSASQGTLSPEVDSSDRDTETTSDAEAESISAGLLLRGWPGRATHRANEALREENLRLRGENAQISLEAEKSHAQDEHARLGLQAKVAELQTELEAKRAEGSRKREEDVRRCSEWKEEASAHREEAARLRKEVQEVSAEARLRLSTEHECFVLQQENWRLKTLDLESEVRRLHEGHARLLSVRESRERLPSSEEAKDRRKESVRELRQRSSSARREIERMIATRASEERGTCPLPSRRRPSQSDPNTSLRGHLDAASHRLQAEITSPVSDVPKEKPCTELETARLLRCEAEMQQELRKAQCECRELQQERDRLTAENARLWHTEEERDRLTAENARLRLTDSKELFASLVEANRRCACAEHQESRLRGENERLLSAKYGCRQLQEELLHCQAEKACAEESELDAERRFLISEKERVFLQGALQQLMERDETLKEKWNQLFKEQHRSDFSVAGVCAGH